MSGTSSDRNTIRIAVAGLGNCASSLLQGLAFYRRTPDAPGVMHRRIGPYEIGDIRLVAAFDIDARKVDRPAHEAIFAPPNNTARFCGDVHARDIGDGPVLVRVGPVLDGFPRHMLSHPAAERFEVAERPAADVAGVLRSSGAQVLVNYMPVGANEATAHYAQACLEAGVALVNCVPVFIASDATWAERFRRAKLPCLGDDIKAQVGATILHRTLVRLLRERGAAIDSSYQLNVGGNTDFLNMLARDRLASKKISKTEAVASQMDAEALPALHVGPSDYVAHLRDNKVCYLRIEARAFGGVPMNMEVRLSVEDSPNSAAIVVDAIRCARLALDRGLSGPVEAASAYLMKHPPRQMTDADARLALERFIAGD